jgi:hypothetical protein
MKFAIITDGNVTNIIEAEVNYSAPDGSEAIITDADNAHIGLGYSAGAGFEQPPVKTVDIAGNALQELKELDKMSMRSIREFVLLKWGDDPLLPSQLAQHEAAAVVARGKLNSD